MLLFTKPIGHFIDVQWPSFTCNYDLSKIEFSLRTLWSVYNKKQSKKNSEILLLALIFCLFVKSESFPKCFRTAYLTKKSIYQKQRMNIGDFFSPKNDYLSTENDR